MHERSKRWLRSRGKFLVARSVAISLRFRDVGQSQQNTVLRNVQMFIGKTPQELIRLKNRVNAVVKYSMTILPMPKDGSFAPTSAQIKPQSRKRLEFAHTAENLFLSIHRCKAYVVQWNAERHDQRRRRGLRGPRFSGNAFNAAGSSGGRQMPSKDLVVSFAHGFAKLIPSGSGRRPIHVSTLPENGFRQEKESSKGTTIPARSVDFPETAFMFTIGNLKEMAVQKTMTIFSPYALIVTE